MSAAISAHTVSCALRNRGRDEADPAQMAAMRAELAHLEHERLRKLAEPNPYQKTNRYRP